MIVNNVLVFWKVLSETKQKIKKLKIKMIDFNIY